MKKITFFVLCFLFLGLIRPIAGQTALSEGFETGLPLTYSSGSYTLSSGDWDLYQVSQGTGGVTSGSYSCQLQSATGSYAITPVIATGGISTISFYASASTSSGRVQVNYSINGGSWISVTGSPFSLSSSPQQITVDLNLDDNNLRIQFRRTEAIVYLDDVNIQSNSSTPATEPSEHVTGLSATPMNVDEIRLSWIDSDALNYLIKGSDESYAQIVAPLDGTPENNGGLVLNVTSGDGGANMTGLTTATTYYFKVYPYNGTGGSINYKTDGNVPEVSETTMNSPPYAGVFISEYIEGSSLNKALEIINLRDETIQLDNFSVRLATNGGGWIQTETLSGSLLPGQTYTLVFPTAALDLYQRADLLSSVTNFNGDDAVGLFYLDIAVDIIGNPDNDPGTGWSVAGTSGATVDHTLVRKLSITEGSTDWSVSAGTNSSNSEWQVFSIDYFLNAGVFGTAWIGETSNNWGLADNWDIQIPDSNVDVLINANRTFGPTISTSSACRNLKMEPGSTLLGSQYLTVGGTTIITVNTQGYTDSYSGWQVIGPAVSGMSMANSDWVPLSGEDDLYAWDEAQVLWRHYLDGSNDPAWFDNFDVGTGYLTAYSTQQDGRKCFMGELNTNESYLLPLGKESSGWNLISNPFSAHCSFNPEDLDEASSPKVMDANSGAWTDMIDEINVAQGVFVFAETSSASITFQRNNLSHPAVSKNNPPGIKLMACSGKDKAAILLTEHDQANDLYNYRLDARYLPPLNTLPTFYAITSDEIKVSKKSYHLNNQQPFAVSLFLQVDSTQIMTMQRADLDVPTSKPNLFLYDQVEDSIFSLEADSPYYFRASPEDPVDRFQVSLTSPSAIHSFTDEEELCCYFSYGKLILNKAWEGLVRLRLFNLAGALVCELSPGAGTSVVTLPLLSKGWYLVQLTGNSQTWQQKIYISSP